jgi:hypothetical protein
LRGRGHGSYLFSNNPDIGSKGKTPFIFCSYGVFSVPERTGTMVFAQLTPERMRPRAVPEQCLNAILIASENLYQIGKIQN